MIFRCCVVDHSEPKNRRQRLSARTHGTKTSNYGFLWEVYTLKDLTCATHNFSEDSKLGEGGFGTVYYGKTSKGEEIAVKRLKAMTAKAEMEFAIEVEILGRVRHKNLLGLRGFYASGSERLIVYDYMPNQSLLSHLHGHLAKEVMLDWPRRMAIMVGSAEGVAYLHHQATPHIIHRDIKASNVLIDSSFRAKVADFGFAKLIPDGVSHVTTRVKGTLGYLAPEYAMWGKVSESCDVYSLGILLLETVSAKRPIEKLPNGLKQDIVQWATPRVAKEAWESIVDPRLGDKYDRTQVRNVVTVAMRCVDGSPENRPTMKGVVELLKGEWIAKEVAPKRENGEKEKEKEKVLRCGANYPRIDLDSHSQHYIARNLRASNARMVKEM